MKLIIATLIVLLVFLASAPAQTPSFQSYFLLKKNEPVSISTIFQDKAGFIWYGTNKGLFKFDGLKFRRYNSGDSLHDSNVTAIGEDSTGRIWVGHKNGLLAFIENDKVIRFETAEGSVHQEISKIIFDKKGILWFSTLSDGLYYVRNKRLNRLDEANGMPDLYVYDIAEDETGKIWAGTDGGLAICTLSDTATIRVLDYKHGMPDNIIKKIVITPDGRAFLATDNSGIIQMDPGSTSYKMLYKNGWHLGGITDFIVDGNQVWIASAQTGLVLYDRASDETKIYNSKSINGITSINALLKDTEGNIWAGSKVGILRTLGDFVEYIDTSTGGGSMNVEAVAIDAEGSVWWAGKEGLFKRTLTETGDVAVEKQLTGTGLEKLAITSLYFDDSRYLWVGLYGEGVLRIDPVTGRVVHLNHELRNGNVLNITGKGNKIWLATLEGAMEITTNGEKMVAKSFSSHDGLSSDYIYQVFIDSKDRIWFATDGKGADMLDAAGFHHFQDGLNSKIIYGFAEDSNHAIWVNVAGEGLYKLAGSDFVPLSADAGLRDNSISCLASTTRGNLLVMHDLGMDLYDLKQNKFRYPGDESGMRDKTPNLNATTRDSQGRIYFGTVGGIVVYSDLRDQLNSLPRALIDGVKVLDKPVDFSRPMTLAHDQNFITLDYLGLWYQNPENLFYQIKLDNYDRDWTTRRDHSATYSNLPPGNYTFRLRVSDTRDFTNAKEATVRWTIDPPFWKTPWFFILSSIIAVGAGYLLIKNREQKLVNDKRALETKVLERTIEIQRKTEEIQTQNEEIHSQAEEIRGINENLELLVKERTLELIKKNKALEEYAFITAHKLRAPVASVLGLINLASKLELDDESKLVVDHLQVSAEKLDSIIRSITIAIEKGE